MATGLTESGFNWGFLGQQAGLGVVLGLAVGYTLKKAVRASLVLIGVLTATLVALARMGFISIHWEVIESAYQGAMAQVGGAPGLMDRILAWFSSSIAVAGSFTVGFWLGFRKG